MRGRDLLETALCGGISYWANVQDVVRDGDDMPVAVAFIGGGDAEASEHGLCRVRCGQMLPAAREVVRRYPDSRGAGYIRDAMRLDNPGLVDAEAADMILQVAAFGEVIYG